MLPLVLYHGNCWDGFGAAWIARMALGDIETVPVFYGQPPPNVKGREIYLLDFSYSYEIMAEMAHQSASFVVLDHHKTAEGALADLQRLFITNNMAGHVGFANDKSGARLSFEWFAPIGGWLAMDAPWIINYVEDRDLWRHALPNSKQVNATLRSYPLDFGVWDQLVDRPLEELVKEGETIRRLEEQQVQTHVNNAHEVVLAGHKIMITNATTLFSEVAGELAKGRPFGACYYDRKEGLRVWSLRSTTNGVDVSEIAKSFGGGGHKHAAGFKHVIGSSLLPGEF